MSKTRKILLTIAIVIVLLAAVGVWGYFTYFHNADVLTVVDGKFASLPATCLTARFSKAGAEEQYYKVADVSATAPSGYARNKKADDPDGDSLTTFFAYTGRDPDKNPGAILIQGVSSDQVPEQPGESPAEINGQTGLFHYEENGAEQTLTFYMDSPYEDARIAVTVTMPSDAGKTRDDLTAILASAVEKITPGVQMSKLAADFKQNFIDDDRYQFLWNGLLVTLEITLFAVLLGIAIGVVIATVRSTWDQNRETMHKGLGKGLLSVGNKICEIYLTVIRGTPVVIQLMIMYFIVFASSRNSRLIAILSFGINSGAYVAEIIRGGIMSIDHGQLEAGRSLGFNYVQTMGYIIIPQALKNVLPALANEFIVLLKETSVVGYVAEVDLTKAGDIIRGTTHSAFMPLLAVAAIYLVMVMFFTWLVGKLERRLRNSDH